MKPSLANFEVFLTVASAESITNAAEILHVTKAAVSQSIKVLEDSLDIPLFIRSTRKIELTEEGRLLQSQCERLQTELDTARNLVTTFKKQPSGKLRISCNPYLAETRLFSLIQQYTKEFSKVELDLILEERMPNMYQESVDIVFGVNWPAPEDVIARKIATTRYVLCASPNYLKQFGEPKTIADLDKHIYIPHSARSKANIIVTLKKPTKLKLNTPIKANNANFMKQCALAGMGIIQLHDYMVEKELKSGELIEILQQELKPDISLFVYYYKHRYAQPKIRQFIDLAFKLN